MNTNEHNNLQTEVIEPRNNVLLKETNFREASSAYQI